MAGVVEEPHSIGTCSLQAPHVGVADTRQRAKPGVTYCHNVEAKALECLFKKGDIVVRNGEPTDVRRIGFVAGSVRAVSKTC